ncbi:MAG: cobalamin-dependent protein [Thermosipho sp. (in: Bacteria)]|nr:cobalamin B12-binding domain-containing protein [Thermosipho sp. (in: thermotogales)]MCD6104278.1 cobalamin-dependent protein [Thermosipho sp. (in: thermotogales)]
MSKGLYSTDKKNFDKTLNLKAIKPYGDTMNDGKTQLSFTLPVPDGEEAVEAAKQLMKKMGFDDPMIVYHKELTKGFTFFIAYGSCTHTVDYTAIHVPKVKSTTWSMEETDEFIKKNIGRKIRVIGATTGTDAHTVGIDAIMNMKGYAGHYGLERYKMFETLNMGSQVPNEEFVAKAIEFQADALLVSQTVTQKNIHIKNLTELVEILEAEGIRDKVILIAGGPRITHELAKELGYDAGFGANTYAEDVASYIAQELYRRIQEKNKNTGGKEE